MNFVITGCILYRMPRKLIYSGQFFLKKDCLQTSLWSSNDTLCASPGRQWFLPDGDAERKFSGCPFNSRRDAACTVKKRCSGVLPRKTHLAMSKPNIYYYLSGEELLVGDSVKLDNSSGTVVFVIPSNQYSAGYPEKEWYYLKEGFGVETEKYGLVHQVSPDEDLVLISA